jgi:hypothetical protein
MSRTNIDWLWCFSLNSSTKLAPRPMTDNRPFQVDPAPLSMSSDRNIFLSFLLVVNHSSYSSDSLSSSISMSTSPPSTASVYLSIAYTLDMLLSCHHPLIPWLAMRQSDRSPLHLGQKIGLEDVHGVSFPTQPLLLGDALSGHLRTIPFLSYLLIVIYIPYHLPIPSVCTSYL